MDSTSQLTKSVSDLLSDTGRDALPAVLEKILTHFDCVTGTVHLLGDDGMLDLLAQRGIPESILPMV
ncbi:MAG: hypothetical protein ACI9MB_004221, partial [Verrucomicrobiales bacterium]